VVESKLFARVRDLAKIEKINEAYLGRVHRLTLFSPKIIEARLSGQQREELELAELLKPFPIEWKSSKISCCAKGGRQCNIWPDLQVSEGPYAVVSILHQMACYVPAGFRGTSYRGFAHRSRRPS
jgi:hypothetical protein